MKQRCSGTTRKVAENAQIYQEGRRGKKDSRGKTGEKAGGRKGQERNKERKVKE